MFAGKSGVSLELRRGNRAATSRTRPQPAARRRRGASPPPRRPLRAPAGAGDPAPAGRQAERTRWPRARRRRGTFAVDLTNPTLQSLGSGFFVGPTSVTDSSGGLRVRGRIVNSTSVDQARAEFRLGVGKREVSFLVARVCAGGSAPFSVELPENAKADVRSARMRWLRSTVRYGEE